MDPKSRNYMRKWRYSRRKSPVWLDMVLAVVIAITAHAVFFGIFKYKEPDTGSVRQGAMVTFYNLNGLSEREKTNELDWLNRHDPKLAVRGDSPIGFSSFLPEEKSRKITVSEFRDGLELPEKKKIIYKPLAAGKAVMPEIPAGAGQIAEYKANAVVLDSLGRKIDLDMSKIAVENAGTSRFVVRGRKPYQRVDILQSCSIKQDIIASERLLDTDLPENEHITVIWLKGAR